MYLHFLLLMDGMVTIAVYMFTRDVHVAGETEPSGQFVSTYYSTCFNPGQFGAGTKHRSQGIILPIQKVS